MLPIAKATAEPITVTPINIHSRSPAIIPATFHSTFGSFNIVIVALQAHYQQVTHTFRSLNPCCSIILISLWGICVKKETVMVTLKDDNLQGLFLLL